VSLIFIIGRPNTPYFEFGIGIVNSSSGKIDPTFDPKMGFLIGLGTDIKISGNISINLGANHIIVTGEENNTQFTPWKIGIVLR